MGARPVTEVLPTTEHTLLKGTGQTWPPSAMIMDAVDLALEAASLVLAALSMGWYPPPRHFNLANMQQLLWDPRAVLRSP